MTCQNLSGVASIVTKVEETCPPTSKVIENKIDDLGIKMEKMMDKLVGCNVTEPQGVCGPPYCRLLCTGDSQCLHQPGSDSGYICDKVSLGNQLI